MSRSSLPGERRVGREVREELQRWRRGLDELDESFSPISLDLSDLEEGLTACAAALTRSGEVTCTCLASCKRTRWKGKREEVVELAEGREQRRERNERRGSCRQR